MKTSLKILHCADWHVRDSDIDECKRAVRKIVSTASLENPYLVVIAGDLTHRQDQKLDSPTTRLIFQAVKALADVAPVVIVDGTPSHDGGAPEILEYLRDESGRVWVASSPQQVALWNGRLYLPDETPDTPDAVITLVPALTKKYFQTDAGIEDSDREIAALASAMFAGFRASRETPHILVGHFAVGGAYVSETQQLIGREIEFSKEQIVMAEADLVCLGHIHKAQHMPESNIFYSGSIYPLDFGELDEKGFYMHELALDFPDMTRCRFIQTDTRKMIKLEADMTDEGATPQSIFAPAKNGEFEGAHIRFELTCWHDEAGSYDREEIEQFFLAAGAKAVDAKIIRIPRKNVRSINYMRAATLEEKLAEQAKIREEEIDPDIMAKARDLQELSRDEIYQAVSNL